MNFTGDDRKEVFFFFEEILRSYKQPVYYENLRGHVSKAPVNVRKYVLTKCKGDNFLEYFRRRKNYFNVENGKLSLKEEFGNEKPGNSHSNKSKKKNSKGKFVRRSTSFSHSSYASALKGSDSNKNGEREYETIAITYFRNRLIRKKKERLWGIEINDLPKKVKRHLQLYYRSNVKSFLSDYPDKFVLDSDDETVSLSHGSELNKSADPSLADQESAMNLDQNSADTSVDSEIKNATEYLECVVFFIDILKKLNQPFPLEKLGGYFSQARKEIKDHLKINYRSFKFFFDDAPLIFSKNVLEEISLSKEYRKLVKAADNLIKDAKNGQTSPSKIPLKSHIDHIFQPQISSRRSSLILEETDNIVLSLEDMANAQEEIEDMLKLHYSDESTEDFFDNYLMRSTSRESSISLSSRSTRSLSVEHSPVKDSSVIKVMERFGTNTMQDFNKEIMENTFLKCIFSVELFCLEFMESELNYIQNYENKAVEYFLEILDSSSTKLWRLNSLQGSVGNNRDIAHFMNKLYRGEKFASFFEKHPQFEVDSPFVKVALYDKGNSTEDSIPLSKEKIAMKNLQDLYELSDFKSLLKETYTYLYDVCKFCKDKDDVKTDRLNGILARFPSCLNMIKSSKGQTLTEKIEHFLHKTIIFEFPQKGSIFFPYNMFFKKCHILFAWFEKIDSYNPSLEFISFSDFWTVNVFSRSVSNSNKRNGNNCINLEECYQHVVDIIKDELESRSELNYCKLPQIIPENALFSMTNGNYYSRPIISALLESGNFRLKDGKISLQRIENYNLIPSDYKDNKPTETLFESENHISEESSDGQNIIDSNQVYNSSSPSVDSKDVSNYSEESKTELEVSSNQSLKISQKTLNKPTKTLCKLENHISEESSDGQNITDNNQVNNSSSPFVNNKDVSSLSKESKTELEISSNQSSKISLTTGYYETKETDLSFKNDKMPVISMNENHISEALKESLIQEVGKGDKNVPNPEENLSSDKPSANAENVNLIEETMVLAKTSKSVPNSKISNLVGKESEYVDESSDEHYRHEVSSKLDSDVLERLSVPSPLQFPEFCEFERCPKENQSLLSMHDSSNLLISKDQNEQDKKCVKDQIILTSDDLNLNTNYIASLKLKSRFQKSIFIEKYISVQSQVKALEKDSLTKHNTELKVANKSDSESNIKASKVEQNYYNISFISEDEDKESSKFEIDLLSKQNSNDAETEMTKGQMPDKDTIIRVFEHSTDKNRSLHSCKVSDQKEEESFQNNVPQVSNFSDTKNRISVPIQDFKEIKESSELQAAVCKNTSISIKQSFTCTPEELLDTSLMKQYLSSEKVSEERNHPRHDVNSEEEKPSEEVPFGYTSGILTAPHDEMYKVNNSRTSSYNDLSSEYPMQPITAKVVLLTNSSCIALTDIKKCKKNIYFSKFAFNCEHQDDCSECFSALQIGDEVSCFLPLTEISQKIWIAFMVTKDSSDNSSFGIFEKLKENAKTICEESTKALSISAHMKRSVCRFGCQAEVLKCDNYSQTDINSDVDLHRTIKEASCQTSLVFKRNASVQTENLTSSQTGSRNTEIPLNRKCAKSEKCLNGDFENDTSRNSWEGEITLLTKNVSCQTFSTGQIMMLRHHPM